MHNHLNAARPPIKPRLTPEGQRLTETRLFLDIKVQDAASSIGVNPARIAELERGKHHLTPSLREIKQKLDAFYEAKISGIQQQ